METSRLTADGRCRLLLGALAALVWACPAPPICPAGVTQCGKKCVDLASDSQNCGACGLACQAATVCEAGLCVCRAGTVLCGGQCVVTSSDPRHCGGCAGAGGVVCAPGQVCEAGACQNGCGLGTSRECGGRCADISRDEANCGGCGVVCAAGRTCHGGICSFDFLVSCPENQEVVGLGRAASPRLAVLARGATGGTPQALAVWRDVVLFSDSQDGELHELRLGDFSLLPGRTDAGAGVTAGWVEDPFLYAVAMEKDTLYVFERTQPLVGLDGGLAAEPDAGEYLGAGRAGLALSLVAQVGLGAGASPRKVTKRGADLWVTLSGSLVPDAGQEVAWLDAGTPAQPVREGGIDLRGFDLEAFPGGSPLARPEGLVFHRGSLYVALKSTDFATGEPAGPGLLAKIDLSKRQTSSVRVAEEHCLGPTWLASGGGGELWVGCEGARQDGGEVEETGLAVLGDNDQLVATWSPGCGVSADGGCVTPRLSRFALAGTTAVAGELATGRVFQVALEGRSLVERLGYAQDSGTPLQVCTPPADGGAALFDLVGVP